MKTNWPTKKLGEVCEIYQPQTITSNDILTDGPYKVFGANGVIGYYTKYNHEDAEVLVTCRGATCGTVNMSEPKSWVTGNAMVVHPKSEKEISKEYIYYLLKGGIDMSTTISGSAQPQITRTTLYPIEIPLPPIETQKKIVAKLERVLAKIGEAKKLRAEARENADNLLSAELHKIFSEGRKKGWEEKTFHQVCKQLFAGGDVPQEFSAEKTEKFTTPIYSNGMKNKGLYGFTDIKKVQEPAVTISGRGTIGYSEVRREPFYPAIRLIVLIPKDDILDVEFLKYITQNMDFRNSGTSIPQLTVPMVKNRKIPLPPLAEQKRIVKHLDSLSQKLQKLQEYQKSTQSDLLTLEQAILHKAFLLSPTP